MLVILVGKAAARWAQLDHPEPYYSGLPFVWRFLDEVRRTPAAPAPPGTRFLATLELPDVGTAQLFMSVQSSDTIRVHDIIIN